ncbi:MAG: hypothetical protein OEY49_07845 [Candidatus Heimdallarchaeota archaeon]|nr:hypothetical protein [Candidatus Heimdallarchaeota archaeon]
MVDGDEQSGYKLHYKFQLVTQKPMIIRINGIYQQLMGFTNDNWELVEGKELIDSATDLYLSSHSIKNFIAIERLLPMQNYDLIRIDLLFQLHQNGLSTTHKEQLYFYPQSQEFALLEGMNVINIEEILKDTQFNGLRMPSYVKINNIDRMTSAYGGNAISLSQYHNPLHGMMDTHHRRSIIIFGFYDPNNYTIVLSNELKPEDSYLIIVVHEFIHVLQYFTLIGIQWQIHNILSVESSLRKRYQLFWVLSEELREGTAKLAEFLITNDEINDEICDTVDKYTLYAKRVFNIIKQDNSEIITLHSLISWILDIFNDSGAFNSLIETI